MEFENSPIFPNAWELELKTVLDVYYQIIFISPFKLKLDEGSNVYFLQRSTFRAVSKSV